MIIKYPCPVCGEQLCEDTDLIYHEEGASYGIRLQHLQCGVFSDLFLFEDGGTADDAYKQISVDYQNYNLRKDVEHLLSYFSSGNSIPVEKVTIQTSVVKDLFSKYFPNHEWSKVLEPKLKKCRSCKLSFPEVTDTMVWCNNCTKDDFVS